MTPGTQSGLDPFTRQKAVLLTTYRRDGRPGATPVSIAVDGTHAYIRSYQKSLKTRRLRRNPAALIAPSDMRGNPLPGPELPVRLRLLEPGGTEERHARRLLRRKYPLLHGAVVPLTHRLLRRRTGRTVHFRADPR
ncbi:PPOX class F420-dependent oxidoreductase [Streptomyces sp. JJ36]|uniref:PPOX class F420-dependent oxidoreductase n=1 Tax=Streptomyces sp. JJ36 TaxID=2736645 RepID=UPI001F001A79|nr:PPOX class F420-dependent oxidoreductase [Streptomyces sp. JJ36]